MRYRTARDADSAGVAEVYLASRKTYLSYAPLAHSDEDVRRWIRYTLIPMGSVTVALQGNEVVGMMATSIDEKARAWVDHLYLEPLSVGQAQMFFMSSHSNNAAGLRPRCGPCLAGEAASLP